MSNLLKDIAVLLFTAGDEIEAMADGLKKKREKRFNEYQDKLKEERDAILSRTGFASKDDIESLKEQIRELSQKLDSISK